MEGIHDVQGTADDLLVGTADVLAHHAQHGKLHAPEETDDEDHRRPPRNDEDPEKAQQEGSHPSEHGERCGRQSGVERHAERNP